MLLLKYSCGYECEVCADCAGNTHASAASSRIHCTRLHLHSIRVAAVHVQQNSYADHRNVKHSCALHWQEWNVFSTSASAPSAVVLTTGTNNAVHTAEHACECSMISHGPVRGCTVPAGA